MFNIKMREFDKCNSFLVYSSFTICSFCGGKPCPDYGSIGHHWWSSGQDLCFRCRGSPSGEGSNPGRGRSWSDPNNPPKWWPRRDIHKSRMLQGLRYDAVTHRAGALALTRCNMHLSLCSPPHSAGVLSNISILGGSYVEESPAPITEA